MTDTLGQGGQVSDQVSDEPLLAGSVLPGHDDGLAYRRVLEEDASISPSSM